VDDPTQPDRPAVIHAVAAKNTPYDPTETRLPSIIIQAPRESRSSNVPVERERQGRDSEKTETPQDRLLQPGEIIANRFRVERVLDSGSMARVYLAVQLSMDRYVAIKVIRSRFVASPRQLKHFKKSSERSRGSAAIQTSSRSLKPVCSRVVFPGSPWSISRARRCVVICEEGASTLLWR
jgi:serine/threonine protein kinase